MEALGGTCEVGDRDDGLQGSVFSFTFPYRPDPQRSSPRYVEFQKSILGDDEQDQAEIALESNVVQGTLPLYHILTPSLSIHR